MPSTRSRGARLLCAAALLAAVACTDGGASPTDDTSHNETALRELTVTPDRGRVGFAARLGVVGLTAFVAVTAKEPVTIVDVVPWAKDADVDLLAARAVFHGHGTSPGGYRMTPGAPLVTCMATWPVSGYGPSYPVPELKLVPGDGALFLFYLRSSTLGTTSARGYRITYRTSGGETRVVTGDTTTFEMELREPVSTGVTGNCNPKAGAAWGKPAEGFPG